MPREILKQYARCYWLSPMQFYQSLTFSEDIRMKYPTDSFTLWAT